MCWQFLNIPEWVICLILILLGLIMYFFITSSPTRISGSNSSPPCVAPSASFSNSSENVSKTKKCLSTKASVKKRKAAPSFETSKANQPSTGPTPAGNSLRSQSTPVILVPSSVTVVSTPAGSVFPTNAPRRRAPRRSASHVEPVRAIARSVYNGSACPVVTEAPTATTQRIALEAAQVENLRILGSTTRLPSISTERTYEELGQQATPVTTSSSPVVLATSTSFVNEKGKFVAGFTTVTTRSRFVEMPASSFNYSEKREGVSVVQSASNAPKVVQTASNAPKVVQTASNAPKVVLSTSNAPIVVPSTFTAPRFNACQRATAAPRSDLASTSQTTRVVDKRTSVLYAYIPSFQPSPSLVPPAPPPTPPSTPSEPSSLSSSPPSTPLSTTSTAPPRLRRAPRTKLFDEYKPNSEPEDKKLDLRGQRLDPAMHNFRSFYTSMEHMYIHNGYMEEDRYIYVVTGYGKLNEGRPPVIKPAVQYFLTQNGIRHNWLNDGLVMIDFCQEEDEEMESSDEWMRPKI